MTSIRPIIEAVDLFCGAGGLTCGLERTSKIKVRYGIDIDPSCEFPYTYNNHCRFLLKRVEDITTTEMQSFYSGNKVKLLAGCAPCQTFSRYYNPKKNFEDSRWELLSEFGRLINGIKPEFVTMENVPDLRRYPVFITFLDTLTQNNYNIWYDVVDSSDYGLPQRRKRLVLLASKLGKISLLSPNEVNSPTTTVWDAIGGLENIPAGGVGTTDALHRSRNLSQKNLDRIRHTSEGGGWREWPPNLVLKCHKKKSGQSFGSVYGRMRRDFPSPTITTQFFGLGNGRFGHPEQDRAISLREGAILQGFPQNYQFTPPDAPISFEHIGRLIGNAVPVRLGEIIAMSFVKQLQQYKQFLRRKKNDEN